MAFFGACGSISQGYSSWDWIDVIWLRISSFTKHILFDCTDLLIQSAMSSPITPDFALANLQATALTARCHNVFFRQKQLKSLHEIVRNNAALIKDAIKQDTLVSDAEATTEVALALDVVKGHYSSVEPKTELEEEYRITNGKDASDRREPWGVVYVDPQRSHTPFFSVVVALSAALAAGNCVALKVRLPKNYLEF
jgi:aldehyde dehydrogenase (NAD+)